MTLFGNWEITSVILLDWIILDCKLWSYWTRVPPTQYNRCPHKKTETQEGSYLEAEARAALRQLQDRRTWLLAGHWPSFSRAGKGQGRTSCPFRWSVVPLAF